MAKCKALAGSAVKGLIKKLINQSNKLGEWVIEYTIILHGLAQQWRSQKKRNIGTKVA